MGLIHITNVLCFIPGCFLSMQNHLYLFVLDNVTFRVDVYSYSQVNSYIISES